VLKLVSCCLVAVSNSESMPVGVKSPSPAGSGSLLRQDGKKNPVNQITVQLTIHRSLLVNSLPMG